MGLKCLKKFRETLMINLLHNFYFSFHWFSPIWFEKLKFLIYFYSNFLIKSFMKAYSNYSICALTNSFTYNVIINVFNMTAISAKLILLRVVDVCFLAFLILFNFISKLGVICLFFWLGCRSCICLTWNCLDATLCGYNSPCLPIMKVTIWTIGLVIVLDSVNEVVCSRHHFILLNCFYIRIYVILKFLGLT